MLEQNLIRRAVEPNSMGAWNIASTRGRDAAIRMYMFRNDVLDLKCGAARSIFFRAVMHLDNIEIEIKDIDIEITGLRPGEKLTEALLDETERSLPCAHKVLEVVSNSSLRVSPAHLAATA